ncbi:MAG: beta-propeller domain-containing protein [Cystobacterineae bacterium]|nr:beta-propeller domain-containing protein [Cystobacterineae bacterium]
MKKSVMTPGHVERPSKKKAAVVCALLSICLACPAKVAQPTNENLSASNESLNASNESLSASNKSLSAFASEEELNAWLQEKKSLIEKTLRRQSKDMDANKMDVSSSAASQNGIGAAPKESERSARGKSITNNQTVGVDEGGIVKLHKNHLVVLRRGRLFTVHIGDKALQPVDMKDAFAPGSSGHAWYDEMLISGNTLVVIGYSYSKGGTEVVLFDMDDSGHLSYRATYVLRSNDYYSSRNYASRLIGNTLIFYTPLYLNFYGNPLDNFPAAFRWQKNEAPSFKPIAPATRIYRTTDELNPALEGIALHTVTTCEIAADKLECSALAVLGPPGREFYVAKDAVYVWIAPFHPYYEGPAQPTRVSSSVFRLPLNAQEAPTALKTYGSPVDQFSFLESADGYLHVLLRAEGPAPSMWASEKGSHEFALLRTPLSHFGDGSTSALPEHYHPLPAPKGAYSFQNRYVGDYLVYGAGETWMPTKEKTPGLAYLLKWDNPQQVESIHLPHRVDRIEALGKAPLLVGGNAGHLYFSVLDFQPPNPSPNPTPPPADEASALKQMARIADTFKLSNAAQGETRSHGFFYKPDAEDDESGLLGLPYARSGRPGWKQLKETSNGILFLRNHHLRFSEAGALTASLKAQNKNDQCKASCTDWYGNSRPLFIEERIFALMGYELVEGEMVNSRLKETRRIHFFQNMERKEIKP